MTFWRDAAAGARRATRAICALVGAPLRQYLAWLTWSGSGRGETFTGTETTVLDPVL